MNRRVILAVALGSAALACNLLIGLTQEPSLVDAATFPDAPSSADGSPDAAYDSGACGKDCLGGACVGGQCQPVRVATKQGGPFMLTQWQNQLFWSDFLGNVVGFADKFDGSAGILLGAGDSPVGVGADDSGVYIANFGSSGTVVRCPLDGCPSPTVLFDAGFGNSDLVTYGGYVYWLQAYNDAIDRMKEPAGATQSCATTDTNNFDSLLARIATDGTNVYWTETYNDTVLSRAIAGGSPKTLYTLPSNSGPSGIHYDSGVLYFATFGANDGSGTIAYGPPTGATAAQTLAASQHNPYGITTDATDVYWTSEGDFPPDGGTIPSGGGVYRCAKSGCGGNPQQLADGLVDPRGIVVDDVAVYFVTFETGNGDGNVWRLAK